MTDFFEELPCAVTICDKEGIVLYMNQKSRKTFASRGNLIGKSLIDCHNPHSREIIARLLATGGTNCYTIDKNGIKKMIYQSAWFKDTQVAGLIEFSFEIPQEMPHYVRD